MLLGVTAVMALMDKSIVGKYLPIFLAISLFVAINFQHSPVNMDYPSTAITMRQNIPRFDTALWNILPDSIGNIISTTMLVALPFIESFADLISLKDN